MKPISFKEQNFNWTRPSNMTDEECGSLPTFRDGTQSISCWKMTWKERFWALLFGKAWLYVTGQFHPPVYVGMAFPFERQAKKNEGKTP